MTSNGNTGAQPQTAHRDTQSSANPVDAYIDPAYEKFSEEEAFRGACSIAISDILFHIETSVVPNKGLSRPVLKVFEHEFTSPPAAHGQNAPTSNGWWKRKSQEAQPKILASDAFYPFADKKRIPGLGIDVTPGIYKNTFGLYVDDGLFIPVVRFVDLSHLDTQCSYADLNPRALNINPDALIVTRNDESNRLLAQLSSEDWNYHAAMDVLNAIEVAVRLEHELPLEERVAELDKIFNFESIVRQSLSLPDDINTELELEVRRALEPLRNESLANAPISITSRLIEKPENPSTSYVLESCVTFDEDGGFTIHETKAFPNAPLSEPTDFASIKFSPEIGIVTVWSQGLIDDSYETGVGYAQSIVSHQKDQERQPSFGASSPDLELITDIRRRNIVNRSIEDRALQKIDEALEAAKDLGRRHRLDMSDLKSAKLGKPGLERDFRYEENLTLFRVEVNRLIGSLLIATTGIDSPRAWQLRDQLREYVGLSSELIESLAGIDTPAAWQLREEFFLSKFELQKKYSSRRPVDETELLIKPRYGEDYAAPLLHSLAGIDSFRSWEFRNMFEGTSDKLILKALAVSISGLDSKAAWDLREHKIDEGHHTFYDTLSGLDTDRAQDLRSKRHEQFLTACENNADVRKFYTGSHLVGVDTDETKDMRKQLDDVWQCRAIQGLDTKQAWKIREKLLQRYELGGETRVSKTLNFFRPKKYNSWNGDYEEADFNHPKLKRLSRIEVDKAPFTVLESLIGLDTPKAESMRETIYDLIKENFGERFDDLKTRAAVAISYVGSPIYIATREAQRRQQHTDRTSIPVSTSQSFGL